MGPRRYGAENEHKSDYVLKNSVPGLLGTTDADEVNKFRPLSQHSKKMKMKMKNGNGLLTQTMSV